MLLKPSDLIPKYSYAYHVGNGYVDDVIYMGANSRGYKGKLVQDLINDGWSFVMSTKRYNKGDLCSIKPYPPLPISRPKQSIPEPEKIKCPYCKHELNVMIEGIFKTIIS